MKKVKTEITEKVNLLYRKYGIRSMTMDDVARELSISKKTLYENFKDKEELVISIIRHHIDHFNNRHQEIKKSGSNAIDSHLEISREVTQFLNQLNPSVTYDIRKYYPEAWSILMEHKRKNILKNMVSNLKKGIREGLYRSDFNPEVIAVLYFLWIESVMQSDLFQETGSTAVEIFNEIFRYHIRGIASKKGLEYLEKKLTQNKTAREKIKGKRKKNIRI
jgi:AcrR family transcriptional regulator